MNLNFNEENGKYVAYFTVNADFNVHIEKGFGEMWFMQSSVEGGKYDLINNDLIRPNAGSQVLDVDFTALVYPKHIKVVSSVEPTMAVVTEKA